MPRSLAAPVKFSQGSTSSTAGRQTGMRWWEGRRYAFAGPAIPWPVRRFVVGDAYQQSDGGDDVGRGTVALATAASRQTNLGVDSAHPMNEENDLGRRVVDIGDDLLDDGSHDTLLEARVGGLSAPSGFKIRRQCGEGGRLPLWMHGSCRVVAGDLRIDVGDAGKRRIPTHLQFARHQAVNEIGGVILAPRALGLRPQRRQRRRPASSASPCLGAP